MLRVLMVNVAAESRSAAERALRQAEIEVVFEDGFDAAMACVQKQSFDAVVCDLRVDFDRGADLVQWIGSHTPSTRMLIVVEDPSEAFERAYGSSPHARIVPTLDPETLPGTLGDLGPRRGFYGNHIEIELFDYVQMIALTGRDKLIEIQTPRSIGRVWFEHGDIVHAEYQHLRGEPAFYRLLSVGKGEFREVYGLPPPMRTVTRSSTHLLMEAARQADEGILGMDDESDMPELFEPVEPEEEEEVSFADLNDFGEPEASRSSTTGRRPPPPPPPQSRGDRLTAKTSLRPTATDNEEEDFAALVEDSLIETLGVEDKIQRLQAASASSPGQGEAQSTVSPVSGHTIFDDPEMRTVMLDQFWKFAGINGVAIISSTGKVLAEDMRQNSSLVTLAGFYMRGAARIARALGHNVFDGVVARSVNGQQMVMVSMGAASAVLSIEPGADPESVRDAVMGVD